MLEFLSENLPPRRCFRTRKTTITIPTVRVIIRTIATTPPIIILVLRETGEDFSSVWPSIIGSSDTGGVGDVFITPDEPVVKNKQLSNHKNLMKVEVLAGGPEPRLSLEHAFCEMVVFIQMT